MGYHTKNSSIIGQVVTPSLKGGAGVYNLHDNYNHRLDNSWDRTATIVQVDSSTGLTLTEGITTTFTVHTVGFDNEDILDAVQYSIVAKTGKAIQAEDFAESLGGYPNGVFPIVNNIGTFTLTPIADGILESDSFDLVFIHPYDSQRELARLNDLSVVDADMPTGEDITSSFYEISNRFINSQTYMGNTTDYTGPYDVGEVQTDFGGTTGRVYIGVKVTAATTYYNDAPIAGVQVLNSAGTTVLHSWIFNTYAGGSGSTWQTYNQQIAGTSAIGFPVTPLQASNYAYATISTSYGVGRFGLSSSTGSSYTGAANGVSGGNVAGTDYTTTPAPVGDGTMIQSATTSYYAYRETSGSAFSSGAVMRSPAVSIPSGSRIRVIHALTGPTSKPMNPDDTLYVGVY